MAAMLGLALGMAIFILGAIYINEESSYDKGFSQPELIYRVEQNYPDKHVAIAAPRGMAELFAYSNISGIDRVSKFAEISIEQPLLKTSDDKTIFIEHLFHADSSFFALFDYPLVFGAKEQAFSTPRSIVISKAVAVALFNRQDPVGKPVSCGEQGDYTVTGVFDNTRFPSHLTVDAVISMALLEKDEDPWKNNAVYTYIRLHPGSNPSIVEQRLTAIFQQLTPERKSGATSVKLEPITDIYLHFRSQGNLDIFKKSNETALWLIGCLILFVLIGSLVNFTNLIFTETANRVKEIAIRQVVGSGRFPIVSHLYLGVALRCLLAFAVAWVLVLFSLPMFEQLLQVDLSPFSAGNLSVWWQIAVLLTVVIAVSGTYPLFYISLARFAAVLKGNFNNGQKGNSIRKVLLILQFTITCVFIAGVLIISRQLGYLGKKDLGFNSHQVIVIRYGQLQTQFQYSRIKNLLLGEPGVQNISYASEGGLLKDKLSLPLTIDGISYLPHYLCVDTGYLSVLGAHILDGRNFSNIDTSRTIIINRTLASMANIKDVSEARSITIFGKPARIVGIVGDLNLYGFENAIGPMAFTTKAFTLKPFLLVKLNTPDPRNAISAIQNDWKSIEPGYPLRFQFLDQSFEQIFNGYERVNGIFNVFSLSAILLAFSGLFSLSSLVILQRSKEMAIRKVHGAPKWSILLLLNRNFVTLIVISNVLALPATYFLSQKWLNHFAYRINMSPTPFLITFAASVILTIATVSLQSLKVVSLPATRGLRQE